LYNGGIGLDKGILAIEANSKDNFGNVCLLKECKLRMKQKEKAKNADFELAETKATKAIQKHSMNIDGRERNFQIDEAYLLLGKARYYDQRFIPALDAFIIFYIINPTVAISMKLRFGVKNKYAIG
jgi:hypothetical protein